MKSFLLIVIALFAASQFTLAQEFKLDGNTLILPGQITFEPGTDQLTAESETALNNIKLFLEAKTYISLMRIEGHCFTGSSFETNMELSKKRAMAVVKWLVSKGIDCNRLIPVGFADSKPVSGTETAEGKAVNSRIEAVNAMMRNLAIGGMPVDGGGELAGDGCK
jgi:OmpA-OmpF porin, OOP family